MTCHVPEWKKAVHTAEDASAQSSILPSTQPAAKASPTKRASSTSAKVKTLRRSRAREIVRVLAHRAIAPRASRAILSQERHLPAPRASGHGRPRRPERARSRRARNAAPARRASSSAGSAPGVRRTRGDERVADRCERAQHRLGVLVGEDRGDDRVAAGRQARKQVADAGEVVSAVPDLERLRRPGARAGPGCEARPSRADRPAGRGSPSAAATASARFELGRLLDPAPRPPRARALPTRARRARRGRPA